MKVRRTSHGIMFWCKACGHPHVANLDAEYSSVVWEFNNDMFRPTINPSIMAQLPSTGYRCHCFVRDGMIIYLSDCTHDLAGMTLELNDEWE